MSRRYRNAIWSLTLLALSAPAWADFWYRPPKFESTSSNGMFVALIERGTTLEMFKVKDGKRSSQWKVQLPYEPHNVLITDDGQYVVLLDHFGRIGFDEAVALLDPLRSTAAQMGPAFQTPRAKSLRGT